MVKLGKFLSFLGDRGDKYDFDSRRNTPFEKPPCVYNDKGERMNVFFLMDSGNPLYSLSADRYPRWILWDRFNRNLDTHFYVHEHVFNATFECRTKVGVLRESEEILCKEYDRAMRYPDIIKGFSIMFTHSEKLLEKYDNARFAPASSVWYGSEWGGGTMSEKNYELKTKNVSIISSNKSMCEMHRIRADLARYYRSNNNVDCYGQAVDNPILKKSQALEEYRYSIVIENSETSYYFTEKLLDCFAAMTVPIYIGAKKIGDFFNTDGMICVRKDDLRDFGNIDKILKTCSEEDYCSRLCAIKDNYLRVQDFLCYEDYLYEHNEELRR